MTININLQVVIKEVYPEHEADGVFPPFIKEEGQTDNLRDILTNRFLNDERLYSLMCKAYIHESLIDGSVFSEKSIDIWKKENGYTEREHKLIEEYLDVLINYPDLDGNMLDIETINLLKSWRKIELSTYTGNDDFYWYKLIYMMPIPIEFHLKSVEIEEPFEYNEEDEALFEDDDNEMSHSVPVNN